MAKSTFALFFGNRGFFPASLMSSARQELSELLTGMGHSVLMLDADATRHGAVETRAEGAVYARFLAEHRGEYDGVILTLPNFGDENGATAALQDAGVPILLHAYPDDLDRMAPAYRRDAFCGKLSISDVFAQNNINFTALQPHTVHPSSPRFADNIATFDSICRVVKRLRRARIGAIGARVTPFKTVRIDETTLQKHGVDVESFDLSEVLYRARQADASSSAYAERAERIRSFTDCSAVPAESFDNIIRIGLAFDELIDEYELDAVAIRCWLELQVQVHMSPCVLLSDMNNRGIPAACEVDLGNAVMMLALHAAADAPPACLDWNNNYADEDEKCILFHCGPVPPDLMAGPGVVTDHLILENAAGAGCGWGCNTGRIKPMPFTFGSLLTEDGWIKAYLGEGTFTNDPIPADFFGCAGVAAIPELQDVLMHVVRAGHRHHVSIAAGQHLTALSEALGRYLGYDIAVPQQR